MPPTKKPKVCPEGYHAGLKVNLLLFLAQTEYRGIQESIISTDPSQALGNCRKCNTTLAFNLLPSQIAQLTGGKAKRRSHKSALSSAARDLALKLAAERRLGRFSQGSYSTLSKYTYREISKLLVDAKLVDAQPDPAVIRRIVIAGGVSR
jgi:hypothetical protein